MRNFKICIFLMLSFVVSSNFLNCAPHTMNTNPPLNSLASFTTTLQQTKNSKMEGKNFGDGSISAEVLGSTLTISTASRLAGAIGSVIWRNKEFINQDDHGRELQSASSFDNFGECFNPTEAGSSRDGAGPTSTSKLIGYEARGNQLKTTTQMAFWLTANEDYSQQNQGNGCGENKNLQRAQNTTNLSSHVLSKQVTIGFSDLASGIKLPNVIEYLETFQVPESHREAQFEALTGYLGKDFSSFSTYNPSTDQFNPLSANDGEQGLPVILSTRESDYAMGIYSPELSRSGHPDEGYGRFNLGQYNTMKWNAVYRRRDTPAGDYSFRQYVIIGSLSEVQNSMRRLTKLFHTPATAAASLQAPDSASGQSALLSNPLVFDVNFYRQYNTDLSSLSDSALLDHWLNSGISEGRRASVQFSSSEYLGLYSDLMTGFGALNFRSAILHYVQTGAITEQRLGSISGNSLVYNAPLYRSVNPDLSSLTDAEIAVHWLNHGISEGRRAHLNFSSSEYLARYPDLINAFGATNYSAAILHYVTAGYAEGRKGQW